MNPRHAFVPFERADIEQSIPGRFEQQVVRYPHRVAIKSGSEALTYDRINQAANRLARDILRARGKDNEPVAWLLGHESAAILAILAILKAGHVCMPIDPSLPQARIARVLEDSQAKLVITSDRYLPLVEGLTSDGKGPNSIRALSIERIDDSLPVENLNLSILPDDAAYIYYTSGSTGSPVGVVHSHRSLLHRAYSDTNAYRICADDRLSLLTPMSAGASNTAIFGALLNGAAVYPFDLKRQGLNRLACWLMEEEITIFRAAATVFRYIVATLTGREKFPKLRLVRLGGEAVQKRDVELFRRHFSDSCTLRVGLASTETNTVCWYFIDKDTQIDSGAVPVGWPLEDKEVLLFDEAGDPVDAGQVGEIAVRSRYLASGYWRRPELTSARFLRDPQEPDERIFLTGDLGRMRADGLLEHVGRKDFQVKIRGQRIELGEVESALLDSSIVEAAAVAARPDQRGETQLVAYVVPSAGQVPRAKDLQAVLSETLPGHMIPSAFISMDRLPLTPSGKVDRRSLPDPGAV